MIAGAEVRPKLVREHEGGERVDREHLLNAVDGQATRPTLLHHAGHMEENVEAEVRWKLFGERSHVGEGGEFFS